MDVTIVLTEALAALIVCESKLANAKINSKCYSNNNKRQLLKHYKSFSNIVQAGLDGKLKSDINLLFQQQVQRLDDWQQRLNYLRSQSIELQYYTDNNYPRLLQNINDAPLLLYTMGNSSLLNMPQIGIVGSRNTTHSGVKNAHSFAKCLTQLGFAITSGMANGVDTQAHKGALSVMGHTIAVLGSGLLHPYPANNKKLMHEIIEKGGAIISEYIPEATPKPAYFPLRNRIISGLSLGVLVVEASLRSGSLITARLAAEQGREVFAIPGSIHSPVSKGCHQLIRDGALLVENTEHIVEHLAPLVSVQQELLQVTESSSEKSTIRGLSTWQQKVLTALGYDPITMDDLIGLIDINASELNVILMELELAGFVKQTIFGYQRL